jgi:molybdopterin-biosynthesis enzyme MoeA-like protein
MTIPAEILTVGDEILQGRTVNGNAAFLGRALTEIGISVRWSSTVGDVTDDIVEAIHQAFTRVEVVVLTGGLGPTPKIRISENMSRSCLKNSAATYPPHPRIST